MVDVESRPDLAVLLTEAIGEYNGTIVDDRIIIPIEKFQKKSKNPWYGITLYCKPKRVEVDAYICEDKDFTKETYLLTFWNNESLEEILQRSIDTAKKCCYCKKKVDLNDVILLNRKHYCEKCSSKVTI